MGVGFDGEWIDFMRKTNRKFGTIELNELQRRPIDTLEMLLMFERHGVNVIKLRLIKSQIDSRREFAQLLRCTPNLKHVTILNTKCKRDVPPDVQDLPQLKSLKTLEIDASDCSIVECFRSAKLTTITALNFHHEYSLRGESLEMFLQSQEMVTTLTFDSSVVNMTTTMIRNVPFQLTRLYLSDIRLEDAQNHHNRLATFMGTQAQSLKELKMGADIPGVLFECVFANCTQLKTLSLEIRGIPKTNQVYERLEENQSITNLVLLGRQIDNKETLRFFDKLPNIHSVTVPGWCDRYTFRTMAQSWNELHLLATDVVYATSFDGIRFHNLQTLRIRRLCEKVNWNKFTKTHSRLTGLIIEDIRNESCFDSDDIDQIVANINLRRLKLGGKFTPDQRFFEIIWEKCPDLRALELEKSCIAKALTNNICCNLLRMIDVKFQSL